MDHSHLAKRLDTSSADQISGKGDEGRAAAAGTAIGEAEAGDGKGGKASKGAANGGAVQTGGGEGWHRGRGDGRVSGGELWGWSSGGDGSAKSAYMFGRIDRCDCVLHVLSHSPSSAKRAYMFGRIDRCDLVLSAKSAYMFGRIDRCDFLLQHPSISRYHAVIQYGDDSAAFLMDLHSTHKTFLNKQQVKPGTFVTLRVGDVIKFGMSSRLYLFQGPQDLMPEMPPPPPSILSPQEDPSRAERDNEILLRRPTTNTLSFNPQQPIHTGGSVTPGAPSKTGPSKTAESTIVNSCRDTSHHNRFIVASPTHIPSAQEGPSRAERQAKRQAAAREAAREAAEREQRRAVAAGRGEGEEQGGGVSWGMREDAEAEEGVVGHMGGVSWEDAEADEVRVRESGEAGGLLGSRWLKPMGATWGRVSRGMREGCGGACGKMQKQMG
ncbi:unnamed protein product [Closterium sp. Naga37s-1]|nr:unnamed protein product [Closterium sp. Naga37s-1]